MKKILNAIKEFFKFEKGNDYDCFALFAQPKIDYKARSESLASIIREKNKIIENLRRKVKTRNKEIRGLKKRKEIK